LIDLAPRDPGERLLPTLPTLWKAKALLPAFPLLPELIVPPPVSEFLIRGADLMAPGV
jgi:predicted ribosome-associated RNA-binding protein Tma20